MIPALLGKDARNRHPLLLSARELVGALIGPVEQSDMIESRKSCLPVGGG